MSTRFKILVEGLGFTEAPRWHDGHIWFVDYFRGAVFRATLQGDVERIADVPGTPGGLGFLPDGTPLVISQRDFKLLRIHPDGSLSVHADLSRHCGGAANELLVDPQGRAYVSHHGFDFFGGAEPRPASLLLISSEGQLSVAAEDLNFPNGMALLPGGRTLVLAETFASRLTAFDVDGDGALTNRRIWAELPGHTPDGLCADSESAIWVGSPLSGVFLRVREGGEIVDTIHTTDGRWAVACALIGEKQDILCCLTAKTTLEDMPQGRSEAYVETVDLRSDGGPAQ